LTLNHIRIKEIAIPRTKENSLVPFSYLTIKLPLKSIPTFNVEMTELSIPKYNGYHSVSNFNENMKTKVFLCQSNFLFYLKRLNVRGDIKIKLLELLTT